MASATSKIQISKQSDNKNQNFWNAVLEIHMLLSVLYYYSALFKPGQHEKVISEQDNNSYIQ